MLAGETGRLGEVRAGWRVTGLGVAPQVPYGARPGSGP